MSTAARDHPGTDAGIRAQHVRVMKLTGGAIGLALLAGALIGGGAAGAPVLAVVGAVPLLAAVALLLGSAQRRARLLRVERVLRASPWRPVKAYRAAWVQSRKARPGERGRPVAVVLAFDDGGRRRLLTLAGAGLGGAGTEDALTRGEPAVVWLAEHDGGAAVAPDGGAPVLEAVPAAEATLAFARADEPGLLDGPLGAAEPTARRTARPGRRPHGRR